MESKRKKKSEQRNDRRSNRKLRAGLSLLASVIVAVGTYLVWPYLQWDAQRQSRADDLRKQVTSAQERVSNVLKEQLQVVQGNLSYEDELRAYKFFGGQLQLSIKDLNDWEKRLAEAERREPKMKAVTDFPLIGPTKPGNLRVE